VLFLLGGGVELVPVSHKHFEEGIGHPVGQGDASVTLLQDDHFAVRINGESMSLVQFADVERIFCIGHDDSLFMRNSQRLVFLSIT
jgi:hypothetical protein